MPRRNNELAESANITNKLHDNNFFDCRKKYDNGNNDKEYSRKNKNKRSTSRERHEVSQNIFGRQDEIDQLIEIYQSVDSCCCNNTSNSNADSKNLKRKSNNDTSARRNNLNGIKQQTSQHRKKQQYRPQPYLSLWMSHEHRKQLTNRQKSATPIPVTPIPVTPIQKRDLNVPSMVGLSKKQHKELTKLEQNKQSSLPVNRQPRQEEPLISKTTKDDTDAASLGLVEEEKEHIREGGARVVFIRGHPGTGKSTLVHNFVQIIQRQSSSSLSSSLETTRTNYTAEAHRAQVGSEFKPCHFLFGRFDEHQGAVLLSALLDALNGFLSNFLASNSDINQCNDGNTNKKKYGIRNQMSNTASSPTTTSFTKREIERIRDGMQLAFADTGQDRLLISMVPDLARLIYADSHSISYNDDHASHHCSVKSAETATTTGTTSTQRSHHASSSRQMNHCSVKIYETAATSGTTSIQHSHPAASSRQMNSRHRLVYAFKKILKVLCSHDRPVILFLDDLQWADELSLNLVADLVLDESINHLLFVGAYRSNEDCTPTDDTTTSCDTGESLKTLIEKIEQTKPSRLKRIELSNFSLLQINEVVVNMFCLRMKETTSLSEIIYQKTKGDMFFTMQILDTLKQRNVLPMSAPKFQWTWDVYSVRMEMSTFGDILDLITSRIESLPEELQEALLLASFLQSSFDVVVLQEIMDRENGSMAGDIEYLVQVLDLGVEAGLLEKTRNLERASVVPSLASTVFSTTEILSSLAFSPSDDRTSPSSRPSNVSSMASTSLCSGYTFRFANSRIKQAAYSLVPPGEDLERMKMDMGFHLVDIGNSVTLGEKWMLFLAADYLNSVSNLCDSELSRFWRRIELNLKVGEICLTISALQEASTYLRRAIQGLKHYHHRRLKIRGNDVNEVDVSVWDEHYNFCLRLYRSASQAELYLGNFELVDSLCHEVFDNVNAVEDRLPSYCIIADALDRRDRYAEALDLSIQAIEMVSGVKRKRRTFLRQRHDRTRSLNNLKIVKQLLHDKFQMDDSILSLPFMCDEKMIHAMTLLSKMTLRSFKCDKEATALLCVLEQVYLTLTFGLCEESCIAFSSFGLLLSNTYDDQPVATRMALLARKLLVATSASHEVIGQTLSTIAYYIDAWTIPINGLIETFQLSFQSWMKTGNSEFACRSWASSWSHAYAAGFPLGQIEGIGRMLLHRMQQDNIDALSRVYEAVYLTVSKLIGLSDAIITGWDDEDKSRMQPSTTSKKIKHHEKMRLVWFFWSRMQLAFYFGRLEVADNMADRFRSLDSSNPCYLISSIRIFFSGLTASGLAARQSLRDKRRYEYYIRSARKALKEMEKLIKSNRLNVLHRFLLMEADYLGCTRNSKVNEDKMKVAYDRAILAATKGGFIQDAALAHELAGEYFLRVNNPFYPALYFTIALDLYGEWGATAKVEYLQRHRGSCIQNTVWMKRSGSFRLRTKPGVSAGFPDIHKSINLDLSSVQFPNTRLPHTSTSKNDGEMKVQHR